MVDEPLTPRDSDSHDKHFFQEPNPGFADLLSKWKDQDEEGHPSDNKSQTSVPVTRKSRVQAREDFSKSSSKAKALRQPKNVYQQPLQEKADFERPIFPHGYAEQQLLRKALGQNFVFSALTHKELTPLVTAFEKCEFPAGETIIKQGDPGDYFYIVQSGQVAFFVNDCQVGQAGRGASFGELALLYTCPRAATVTALEDTELFRVDQTTFRYILQAQTQTSEQEKLDLLMGVPFISSLTPVDQRKLAQVMTPRVFQEGEALLRKGDTGDAFYVLQEGQVLVTDISVGSTVYDDQTLGRGEYFGERALVTSEPRAANVVGVTKGTAFSIDRETFETVLGSMSKLILKAEDERKLAGIRLIAQANLDPRQLANLAHLITDQHFPTDKVVMRKNEPTAAAIYLVREGKLRVTSDEGAEVVEAGGYFEVGGFSGPKLLQSRSCVEINAPFTVGVVEDALCGVLTVTDCASIFDVGEETSDKVQVEDDVPQDRTMLHTNVTLNELERHKILGEGTFGQVWLVSESLPDRSRRPYALKIQSKSDLAMEGQIKAVIQEKEIMMKLKHPFILNLVKTYSDEDFIYMLVELHQGGELFSVLHPDEVIRGLPESQSKFYTAGITDALAYMHRRKIVFRDLKPENVMIDRFGYPIVIDFGFAKYVPDKTYTLCGTPGYLPPECIMTRGHNCSADHWSLGILICEMATGMNPFFFPGMDQMSLFESIVKDDYEEPEDASDALKDIVSKLLVKDPTRRLGSLARGERDILEHQWLRDVDLHTLRRRQIEAPWVPEIKDELDTGCFDDWDHLEDKTKQLYPKLKDADAVLFEDF